MLIDAEINKRYIPKGSMCINCKNRVVNCQDLPFSTMPVLERWAGYFVVKCTNYEKLEDAAS